MILDVPRPQPPHLHHETTRHGRTVWYVRIGKGPRTRIKEAYGSEEFWRDYRAAIAGEPLHEPLKPATGTLGWLIKQYRNSADWLALARATKRQRENIFLSILKTAGRDKIACSTPVAIKAGRDRRTATPFAARHFLDTMRGLFRWALEAGHVKTDPTTGIKYPAKPRTSGFAPWTEEEVDRYHTRWPIGTKERVWLDLLLYTGLRRGDAVQLGRQHVRDGVATLRTEKSGGAITVTIPILPVLERTLAAGPTADMAFICGDKQRRLTKESFGNAFRRACLAAGVEKSAHGVRKIGATRAAENGATVAELEALFGWQGGRMASLYTRAANRVHLAKGAIGKLEARTPKCDNEGS